MFVMPRSSSQFFNVLQGYLPVLTDLANNIYFANIPFEVKKVKTAKLFQNGQSQAVRLPKEFRFEGNEVFIKKSGSAVVLIPLVNSWDSLIGSLDKFTKDYMGDRDQPKQQKREAIFE
jgi:antitoxin VapB